MEKVLCSLHVTLMSFDEVDGFCILVFPTLSDFVLSQVAHT
jgi:hypothetical protein